MSLPPSSPYKSRIFNAINRTFLTLNDQSKINLNKVKIFATWGLQILLYPIYLGIQTARVAIDKLLNSTHQNSALPPQIEEPIEYILSQIQPQLTTEIKAIATELDDKKIVLITNNNQILHLKNKIQEQQLEKWIKWELANYYYQQKSLVKHQQKSPYLTPIKINNSQVMFPINLFWKMMAWVEKSPLAISLNLFGELQIIQAESPHNQQQINLLTTIDQQIAVIENNQKITTIINSTEQLTEKLTQTIKQRLFKLNLINNSDDPFTIRAIIIAAINYFFGQGNHLTKIKLDSQDLSNPNILDQNQFWGIKINHNDEQKALNYQQDQNYFKQKIDDHWLSSADFLQPTIAPNYEGNNQQNDQSTIYQLTGFHVIPEKPKISALEKIKQLLNFEQKSLKSQALIPPQIDNQTTNNLTVINQNLMSNQTILKVETVTNSNSNYAIIQSENKDEIKEFYVETKATNLGYEKHFLEHLLGWLDHLMLLLEDFLINIFKWLKRKI